MLLRMLDDGVAIHRVTSEAEADGFRDGFVAAYRRVFAQPPYEEDFTADEADAIWQRLTRARDNITLIALCEGEVVAFGSAIPLAADPDVARELAGLVPVRHTMYLAELGVLAPYRSRDLARKLVNLRLKLIDKEKYAHVVLRAVEGKNEALKMYRALDFTDMGVSMDVTSKRVDGDMRTDERHFMSRVLSQVRVEEE